MHQQLLLHHVKSCTLLVTFAGKYVIHFGLPADKAAEVASRSAQKTTPPVTSMALARTDVSVIPTATGNQLVVARPLQLDERMITLACAIRWDALQLMSLGQLSF